MLVCLSVMCYDGIVYFLASASHGAIAILRRMTRSKEDSGRLENESRDVEDG